MSPSNFQKCACDKTKERLEFDIRTLRIELIIKQRQVREIEKNIKETKEKIKLLYN